MLVVEGDFCRDGIVALTSQVKAGTRGLAALFGPTRAICTNHEHTATCTHLFHFRDLTVPAEVAAGCLDALYPTDSPLLVTSLLREVHAGKAVSTLLMSRWRFHPGAALLCERLAPTMGCLDAAAAAPLLPRGLALALDPTPATIEEDSARRALAKYQAYLNGAPAIRHTPWGDEIERIARAGMEALPLELADMVVRLLFEHP